MNEQERAQLNADFKFVIERARTLSKRLEKMEFLSGAPERMSEDQATSSALFIVACARLFGQGTPLSVVTALLGSMWMQFEEAQMKVVLDLLSKLGTNADAFAQFDASVKSKKKPSVH